MSSCLECLMEQIDGFLLVKPTIYIIESEQCVINIESDKSESTDLRADLRYKMSDDDEPPF